MRPTSKCMAGCCFHHSTRLAPSRGGTPNCRQPLQRSSTVYAPPGSWGTISSLCANLMASGGQRLLVLLLWALCACVSMRSVSAVDASLIPWESYHKTEQILDFFKKVSLKVPSRVRWAPRAGSTVASL